MYLYCLYDTPCNINFSFLIGGEWGGGVVEELGIQNRLNHTTNVNRNLYVYYIIKRNISVCNKLIIRVYCSH